MFRTLRNLFRRKRHPATERAIKASTRVKPLTQDEYDYLRGVQQRQHNGGIDLDNDTRERIHRKAQQAKPTPIWPVGCRYVVGRSSVSTMARLADIFEPCPLPANLTFIGNVNVAMRGLRNVTVMVVETNAEVVIALHLDGAHLIDPWGKPVDMTASGETDAERQGRAMREGAAKRDSATNIDAAYLPDFHTCRYSEDTDSPPAFVGGSENDQREFTGHGGGFGGGGASDSWDSSPSPSSDFGSIDMGSSSSDSGSSGGSDW